MRIRVYDVVHGEDRSRDVRMDADTAERLGAEELDAELTSDGDYRYYATETRRWYRLTVEDVREAGASAEHARGDWYSLWCSVCGEEDDEQDDEQEE